MAAPHTSLRLNVWRLALAGLGVAVFAVYAATLAPGLTWANGGADGGDLITAAVVMGVAHPTGYPTYLLLARLALLAPLGPPAFRVNLLSAGCAALAAVLTAALVAQAYSGRRVPARAGGLLAGLALGLAPLVWAQAVIAEVYTLHLLFTAALLWLLPLGGAAPPSRRRDAAAGLLFGLALGNHATILFLLPAWLAASAWQAGRLNYGRLAGRAGALLLGALIYLYIPLRARALPPVSWGHAVDWEGFRWVALAVPYRGLAFGLPLAELPGRAAQWARLVVGQFGWVGLALSFGGLLFAPASRRAHAVTLWLTGTSVAFALAYQTSDAAVYLLPAVLCLALWLGLGLAALFEWLGEGARGSWLLAAGWVLLIAIGALVHWPAVDASHDRRAEDFGRAVITTAPSRALIFTAGDRDTFALWYFHFALGQRPDIVILVEPLLDFDWYRAGLQSTYPDLILPAAGQLSWKAAIRANNARPACDSRSDGTPTLLCAP
jgi:hypothetical protein